ncbi:hypothetical protein GGF43_004649, partial [Coemansia sp. RSA 2618]
MSTSLNSQPTTTAPNNGAQDVEMLLTDEIEASRHHEKTMAQEAANAATFGNIRVLPAASHKYHRVSEMH